MIYPVKKWTGYGYKFWEVTWYGVHHRGVDFICPEGTPLYASFDGRVKTSSGFQGGKTITLEKTEGNLGHVSSTNYKARYMHLSSFAVVDNSYVNEGKLIGYSGNTGALTTGAHLHFDLRINGQWVDPLKYFNNKVVNILKELNMTLEELKKELSKDFVKKDVRINLDMSNGSVWIVNHGKRYKVGTMPDDVNIIASLMAKEQLSDAERNYPITKNRKEVLS